MAVINETISGTTPSATVTPSNSVSEASIGPTGPGGKVRLEAKAPGGEWTTVSEDGGAYSVSTPSLVVEYRFQGVGLRAPVHVFFGD